MFGRKHKEEVTLDMRVVWLALVAFVVMLVVNGIAGSTTLLGGHDTAAVSDGQPNLFAPAGFTFAIWGVIYLLLVVFMVRAFGGFCPEKPAIDTKSLQQVIALFGLSSVLNALWLFAWQFEQFALSVVLMIGLLATLAKLWRALLPFKFGVREWVMIRLPFSVYFGWITIATIANVTTWLVSIGWNGWGLSEGTWMVATLIVGALIVIVTALRGHDVPYILVAVWAYAGILSKHLSPVGHDGKYPSTIITLTILLAVLLNVAVYLLPSLRKKYY